MDAGGLAQMTYNNNYASNGGLGVPNAGFASRGKGSQLKRLNLASAPRVASINENQEALPTPRTSRSHLLAGLRTAPKTPGNMVPQSAPYNQTQHQFAYGGNGGNKFNNNNNMNGYGQGVPQTTTASTFYGAGQTPYGYNANGQQMYSLPEQVLAPPSLELDQHADDQMDPAIVAQLVATEMYLQQRQQQLQQQLLELTARGIQGLNLNGTNLNGVNLNGMNLNGSLQNNDMRQQFPVTPMSARTNMYNQQFVNNLSAPQEVPGQPGVYVVYNAMTGQYNYVVDQAYQQQQAMQQAQMSNSPPPATPSYTNSPPKSGTPTYRADVSPSMDANMNGSYFPMTGRASPPKKTPSPPVEVAPLPPPSANAFRRGHKKGLSMSNPTGNDSVGEGPKSALRTGGFPQTPQTGTFGPGQSRAGEHPLRQPRGPPPFEELKACPTTKHEGSKNFSTRQRRRAVHSLVRAGIERRGVRSGSGGSMTPVSENEIVFPSDNDTDSVHSGGSGSLSGKPSIGSLRAAASGAIGSERKEMKERSRDRASVDGYSAKSVSSDEGSIGGKLVEEKK